MNSATDLDDLSPEQLRALAAQLIEQVSESKRELHYRQTRIDQLTHEISVLKRLQFGKRSEQFNIEQASLADETISADIAAIEIELDQLHSNPSRDKQRQQPKRTQLPLQLSRTDVHHEPDGAVCQCGCERVRIGEDVSEKLDYTPGVFTVERHIRGKRACRNCETLIQAPVGPHVNDKGIPRQPGCSRTCWWSSTATTCPCIDRNASLNAPGWPSPSRPWVPGLAYVV